MHSTTIPLVNCGKYLAISGKLDRIGGVNIVNLTPIDHLGCYSDVSYRVVIHLNQRQKRKIACQNERSNQRNAIAPANTASLSAWLPKLAERC